MAFKAAVRPFLPTEAAMMVLGMMLIVRVATRLSQGAIFHCNAPSLSIWPAIVHTIPAEVPDKSKARAKTVPAAGAKVLESRSWTPNRFPVSEELADDSEAPATMRIALLTKRAKVKSAMTISAVE